MMGVGAGEEGDREHTGAPAGLIIKLKCHVRSFTRCVNYFHLFLNGLS